MDALPKTDSLTEKGNSNTLMPWHTPTPHHLVSNMAHTSTMLSHFQHDTHQHHAVSFHHTHTSTMPSRSNMEHSSTTQSHFRASRCYGERDSLHFAFYFILFRDTAGFEFCILLPPSISHRLRLQCVPLGSLSPAFLQRLMKVGLL